MAERATLLVYTHDDTVTGNDNLLQIVQDFENGVEEVEQEEDNLVRRDDVIPQQTLDSNLTSVPDEPTASPAVE